MKQLEYDILQQNGKLEANKLYVIDKDYDTPYEFNTNLLSYKTKLELCIAAMQTVVDNTGELATRQLLSDILEKVKGEKRK